MREPVAWLFAIAHAKLADLHRRGAVDRRARARLGLGPVSVEDEALERVEALLEEPRAVLLLSGLPDVEREAVLARGSAALTVVPVVLVLAFVLWPRRDEVSVPPPVAPAERVADLPRPIRQAMSLLKASPGTPLSVVRLTDVGGLEWTAVAYRSRPKAIAHTAAPAGLVGMPSTY